MKWIHSALDLDRVIYIETRISLTVLREMFKEMGLREEERKITKAIRTSDRRKAQQSGDVGQWIEGAFNFAAFEITTGYGSTTVGHCGFWRRSFRYSQYLTLWQSQGAHVARAGSGWCGRQIQP